MAYNFNSYDPQSSVPAWADIATITAGVILGLPRDTPAGVPRYATPPPATTATTPIGRSGQPLNVSTANGVPANTPTTIAGRDYTGHALDSMQSRGIMPSVVDNTIQYGVASPGNIAGRTVFSDPVNNISVVIDSASGRVITVRPGSP